MPNKDRQILSAAIAQLSELLWEMKRDGRDSTAVEAEARRLARRLSGATSA